MTVLATAQRIKLISASLLLATMMQRWDTMVVLTVMMVVVMVLVMLLRPIRVPLQPHQECTTAPTLLLVLAAYALAPAKQLAQMAAALLVCGALRVT